MSRYIDADNLEEKKFVGAETHGQGEHIAYRVGWNDAIEAICENEPTIDIVRCKECDMSEVYQSDSNGVMARYCEAFTPIRMVADDDFCSYGERKE